MVLRARLKLSNCCKDISVCDRCWGVITKQRKSAEHWVFWVCVLRAPIGQQARWPCKIASPWGPERGEGAKGHLEESDRGNGNFKRPEAGACLVCSRNSKKGSVCGQNRTGSKGTLGFHPHLTWSSVSRETWKEIVVFKDRHSSLLKKLLREDLNLRRKSY